ncbi:SIMPL domain-containing protein [Clostridium sp. YIM B02515]|uniref:SIMPL domain-containing protein n=1 Tax=Clostridium rhizosphaerae TaxID=2803861 RepID=A0ABS1T7J5_9CLOT|nr:SIMPL domain-containing protein [Clostridium rhizosphaerae]
MYYSNYPYEYPFFNGNLDNFNCQDNREVKLDNKASNLRLEGVGSIMVKPDIAASFLGIMTQNKNLADAQSQNSEISNKVLNALLNLGIEDKDIKTENFSISPEYDYVDGKQIFRGYKVTNNLRITIRDISKVGTVIDTAVNNGVNVVYNVNFTLSNREDIYNKALSLAIKNAVDKALSVEKTLNIAVDTTPSEILEESSGVITPKTGLYTLEVPASATNIKSGEIEIAAKVTAIFNYTEI